MITLGDLQGHSMCRDQIATIITSNDGIRSCAIFATATFDRIPIVGMRAL